MYDGTHTHTNSVDPSLCSLAFVVASVSLSLIIITSLYYHIKYHLQVRQEQLLQSPLSGRTSSDTVAAWGAVSFPGPEGNHIPSR